MQRIVQRYREQIENDELGVGNDTDNSDGDSDEEGLEKASLLERFNGIDLDSVDDSASAGAIWDKLTENERKDFIQLLENNQIDKFITAWRPWWDPSPESKIVEIGNNETAEKYGGSLKDIPDIVETDLPVNSRGANIAVAFEDLSLASPVLTSKSADVYSSAHEALIVSFFAIDESMFSKTKTALLDDLLKLYNTPLYVTAALSDTYSILKELLALELLKQTRVKKANVKYAEKRVYFLLSVAQQMIKDEASWQFMAADIALLRRRFESEGEALENSEKLNIVS
ncbi:Zinc finger HIT domain-containing protein 2 [Coemansia erecta]|nr:Zinc finger HIT domain-containing protein 2 [Coemansia erecta]